MKTSSRNNINSSLNSDIIHTIYDTEKPNTHTHTYAGISDINYTKQRLRTLIHTNT